MFSSVGFVAVEFSNASLREDYWGSKAADAGKTDNATTAPAIVVANGTAAVVEATPVAVAVDGGDIDMLDEEL